MGEADFDAEFDRLGEAEVADRLVHRDYAEERRIYALRWLGDRGLARALAQADAARARLDAERSAALARRWASLAVALFAGLIVATLALLRHGMIR